jgi:hypothetical protein
MAYSVTDHINFTKQGVLYYPNIMRSRSIRTNVIPYSPSEKYGIPFAYFHRN